MSLATMERIDPAEVRMPGHFASGTVADAGDQTLADTLAADYRAIAGVLEQYHVRPTKDGLAPDSWKEGLPRAGMNNLGAVERCERRIKAILIEQKQRAKATSEARQADQASACETLERLLAEAPGKARELVAAAEAAQGSVDRLRQLLADVETVGALKSLRATHAAIVGGAEEAAEALGKEAPDLPALPADTVRPEDVEAVHALIVGRHGGFTQRFKPGEIAHAAEIAKRCR